jgi:hypothetical protein
MPEFKRNACQLKSDLALRWVTLPALDQPELHLSFF